MMNISDEEPPRPKGLEIYTKAPQIDAFDIYDNPIKLSDLLIIYNGVLIDFFRGNW